MVKDLIVGKYPDIIEPYIFGKKVIKYITNITTIIETEKTEGINTKKPKTRTIIVTPPSTPPPVVEDTMIEIIKVGKNFDLKGIKMVTFRGYKETRKHSLGVPLSSKLA